MVTTARKVSADGGAGILAEAAGLSDEELGLRLEGLFSHKAALEGAIVVLLGEVARRQSYRAEGATGPEPWAAERFAVSLPAARSLLEVAEKAWDLPHLVGGLCAGELSLDQVRAVAAVATPESDEALAEAARRSSVRQLRELARRRLALERGPETPSVPEHARVRFNEACHTMTAQLPPVLFAEARACLDARARDLPADAETPYDERLGQALATLMRSGGARTSPFLVVAHVALAALVGAGSEASTLAGELERDGLVDVETLRRLACDATLVVGVDDDVGHTMYEGRARRDPTPAQRREVLRRDRHCRFPGCAHRTFTHTHHVVPWKPGGRTDLDNLALLCVHHHHLVHSAGWEMTGNANAELRFVGPTGRVMTSRPSALWTSVTSG